MPYGLISFEETFREISTDELLRAFTIVITPSSLSKFLSRFRWVILRLGFSKKMFAKAIAKLFPSFISVKVTRPLMLRF